MQGFLRYLFLILCCVFAAQASSFGASREAAFTDPGVSVSSSAGSDAIIVEPKMDIDTGETFLNVARRTTVFFINQSSAPIDIQGLTANSDGNVKADIVSDDCTKGGKQIASASRCAVSIEVTPTSPGAWTAELLLTHNGAGRMVRVKLSGKTGGKGTSDKKDTGLSLSTKDVKPIDFGEVLAGQSKVARTALMVNDSNETIALMSIDVIAADNGLERLDQGCTVDMELKSGESCPVTLLWKPSTKGLISTDLIIRHTGQLGFAVIPIRGNAKAEDDKGGKNAFAQGAAAKDSKNPADKIPMPTTADELDKLTAGKIPPLDSSTLPPLTGEAATKAATPAPAKLTLIGTVGNRALILKPDGTTAVAGIGEDVSLGESGIMKVLTIMPKSVEVSVDGKKRTLLLEASQDLISKASSAASSAEKNNDKGGLKSQAVGKRK